MIERQIVTKTIKTVVAGQVVSLGEVEIEDPNLVLSTYEVMQVVGLEPTTVELSYLGEGTITVTNPNPTALSATYDSVARTITLVNNQSEEDDNVDVNLTVSLNRLGNCVTESVTLTVHCSFAALDPQLTLIGAPNDYDRTYHGIDFLADGTVGVSYLGNGTITVTSSWLDSGESVTYDASSKEIRIDFNRGSGTHLITVSLSVSSPYTAATTSFTSRANDPHEPT